MDILIIFYQNFIVVFAKAIGKNIACYIWWRKRKKVEILRDFLQLFFWIFLQLLIVFCKLYVYNFNKLFTFTYAHLSQRKQKTKLVSTFSELISFLFGVPRRSIFGQFCL